jgi:hypothetical protein
MEAALGDAKEPGIEGPGPARSFAPLGVHTPGKPSQGALHRLTGVLAGDAVLQTLVESHDDVRAKSVLDLDRLFRVQVAGRAVVRGAEFDALVAHAAKVREGKNLITAAVGQKAVRPVHEPAQSAESADQLRSRPEMEMKGIAEDQTVPDGRHLLRGHGLDGPTGSDGHEGWRENLGVRDAEEARPRGGRRALISDLEKRPHP